MNPQKNNLWMFLASVKLALSILFVLAAASIIGTILPQGEAAGVYRDFYITSLGLSGSSADILTKITFQLDLDTMYQSWWFRGLILLLSLNLIVCSIERLPDVWRLVVLDNLATPLARITNMRNRRRYTTNLGVKESCEAISAKLQTLGWQTSHRDRDGGTLLFAQKAPWSRLGVYVVHISILIIFTGALIGSIWGQKGAVNIPETLTTDKIYQFGSGNPVDLGFTVQCNWFHLTKYPNGAPKKYESELVILENDEEILTKTIAVNDPLTYKGWTFYQSSYQSHQKFIISVANNETQMEERFLAPPKQAVRWQQENLLFGIQELIPTAIPGNYKYKLLLSDGEGGQKMHILTDNEQLTITQEDGSRYTFHVKEFYSTGLQVAKDPGVWIVYLGCGLMLIGLWVAFFVFHKRLWILVRREQDSTHIFLGGTTNKNKAGFETEFNTLSDSVADINQIEAQ
ncbi:MAG: cytochrome c biogenesis protein ResB [Desulfurivibrionaceae bacterium]|nr:cytochrome c biogenesis protein ResB [Desulfurivibrionaceae bacterium]